MIAARQNRPKFLHITRPFPLSNHVLKGAFLEEVPLLRKVLGKDIKLTTLDAILKG